MNVNVEFRTLFQFNPSLYLVFLRDHFHLLHFLHMTIFPPQSNSEIDFSLVKIDWKCLGKHYDQNVMSFFSWLVTQLSSPSLIPFPMGPSLQIAYSPSSHLWYSCPLGFAEGDLCHNDSSACDIFLPHSCPLPLKICKSNFFLLPWKVTLFPNLVCESVSMCQAVSLFISKNSVNVLLIYTQLLMESFRKRESG